jgi:hypothetical protein
MEISLAPSEKLDNSSWSLFDHSTRDAIPSTPRWVCLAVISLFVDDDSTATRVKHRVGTFTQGKVGIDSFCIPLAIRSYGDIILMSVQVETNYPRPGGEAAEAVGIVSQPG